MRESSACSMLAHRSSVGGCDRSGADSVFRQNSICVSLSPKPGESLHLHKWLRLRTAQSSASETCRSQRLIWGASGAKERG